MVFDCVQFFFFFRALTVLQQRKDNQLESYDTDKPGILMTRLQVFDGNICLQSQEGYVSYIYPNDEGKKHKLEISATVFWAKKPSVSFR